MVEWVELFKELMERGVAPVFLRLLLYVYVNQRCDVRWNNKFSTRFSVTAGVRQGSVSSGIFFNVYCNRLIQRIRRIGTGCRIGGGENDGGGGGEFFGICLYCDDIFLLSASRAGLQSMMNECESFAANNNLQFSVNSCPIKSKSKCIIFSKNAADRNGVDPILLNNVALPWVSKLKHLGHMLDCNNSMTIDSNEKRGKFIGKVNSLSQEFYFVSPNVLIDMIVKYACCFYGSSTWNLFLIMKLRKSIILLVSWSDMRSSCRSILTSISLSQ